MQGAGADVTVALFQRRPAGRCLPLAAVCEAMMNADVSILPAPPDMPHSSVDLNAVEARIAPAMDGCACMCSVEASTGFDRNARVCGFLREDENSFRAACTGLGTGTDLGGTIRSTLEGPPSDRHRPTQWRHAHGFRVRSGA